MTGTRALSEEEFTACFATPMQNVTANPGAIIDIWPYIDALDLDALCLPSLNDVHYVYRDALGRFDQVLIGTGRFNTLLVIIVDLAKGEVHGHRLLDLNQEYGVSGGHLRTI
jgi:hypothetical protein